jgi:hypothetical protein
MVGGGAIFRHSKTDILSAVDSGMVETATNRMGELRDVGINTERLKQLETMGGNTEDVQKYRTELSAIKAKADRGGDVTTELKAFTGNLDSYVAGLGADIKTSDQMIVEQGRDTHGLQMEGLYKNREVRTIIGRIQDETRRRVDLAGGKSADPINTIAAARAILEQENNPAIKHKVLRQLHNMYSGRGMQDYIKGIEELSAANGLDLGKVELQASREEMVDDLKSDLSKNLPQLITDATTGKGDWATVLGIEEGTLEAGVGGMSSVGQRDLSKLFSRYGTEKGTMRSAGTFGYGQFEIDHGQSMQGYIQKMNKADDVTKNNMIKDLQTVMVKEAERQDKGSRGAAALGGGTGTAGAPVNIKGTLRIVQGSDLGVLEATS